MSHHDDQSPAGSDVLVELRAVEHRYVSSGSDDVTTLNRVDLQVARGEVVAVVGPSGSGKSTLTNIISGHLQPMSGTVSVAGRAWHSLAGERMDAWRRDNIGSVLQNPQLVTVLTVYENVLLPLALAGTPRRDRPKRVLEALTLFGVAETADRWVEQISGGQQQRVAMARATVAGQPLLLADEPTGSLDRTNSDGVFRALVRHADEGGAVVVVSHDESVARYATRVLQLVDGTLHEV